MAIAVLVLGIVTASAGISLLVAGGSAAHRAAGAKDRLVSSAAVRITDPDRPPPIPRPRVSTPAGAHPLLEFSHPALAITGLACWFAYLIGHDRSVAWIAIVIWGITAGSGLRWLASTMLAASRSGPVSRRPFPRWLVLAHGLAAAAVLSLALLTALAVTHS